MWRIVKRGVQRVTNACLGEPREPDEIMIKVGIPVDVWGHWHAGANLDTPTRDLLINALDQIAKDEMKIKGGRLFLWEGDRNTTGEDKKIHWMREAVPGELYRRCSQSLRNEDGVRYPTAGQIVAAAIMQSDEWGRLNGPPTKEQFSGGMLEGVTSGWWAGTAVPLRLGSREDRYARTIVIAAIATGTGTMIMAVVQVIGLACG